MQWNLEKAAERGSGSRWNAPLLAEPAGDQRGKMSMLWTTTPTTIRLEDLTDLHRLECTPATCHCRRGGARPSRQGQHGEKPSPDRDVEGDASVGRNRSLPPA